MPKVTNIFKAFGIVCVVPLLFLWKCPKSVCWFWLGILFTTVRWRPSWASSVSDIFLTGDHLAWALSITSVLHRVLFPSYRWKVKNSKMRSNWRIPIHWKSLTRLITLRDLKIEEDEGKERTGEGGYDKNNHPRPWIQSHMIVGGIFLVKQ